MKELPKRRHNKDSVQIIKIMLAIKQPATIEEIAKQVQLHYNPNPKDYDFWQTFREKLFMGVNCGYIRKDSGNYSLVYPLPTVEQIINDTRNRAQLKLNKIVNPLPTDHEKIADTLKRTFALKLNRKKKVVQKKTINKTIKINRLTLCRFVSLFRNFWLFGRENFYYIIKTI